MYCHRKINSRVIIKYYYKLNYNYYKLKNCQLFSDRRVNKSFTHRVIPTLLCKHIFKLILYVTHNIIAFSKIYDSTVAC